MKDIILSAVLVIVLGGIVFYLVQAKKRGETCVGCPHAKQCGSKCQGVCAHNKNM